jgi:hypothetical protein
VELLDEDGDGRLTGSRSARVRRHHSRAAWPRTLPSRSAPVNPQTLIALQGKVQNPDGLSPIANQWVLTRGNTTVVLGGGNVQSGMNAILLWTPANNVPFHCGGSAVTIHLVATDLASDTGSDSVSATVHFPPC